MISFFTINMNQQAGPRWEVNKRCGGVWRFFKFTVKLTMVKLTPELIQQSSQHINPLRDRELSLRGVCTLLLLYRIMSRVFMKLEIWQSSDLAVPPATAC